MQQRYLRESSSSAMHVNLLQDSPGRLKAADVASTLPVLCNTGHLHQHAQVSSSQNSCGQPV